MTPTRCSRPRRTDVQDRGTRLKSCVASSSRPTPPLPLRTRTSTIASADCRKSWSGFAARPRGPVRSSRQRREEASALLENSEASSSTRTPRSPPRRETSRRERALEESWSSQARSSRPHASAEEREHTLTALRSELNDARAMLAAARTDVQDREHALEELRGELEQANAAAAAAHEPRPSRARTAGRAGAASQRGREGR